MMSNASSATVSPVVLPPGALACLGNVVRMESKSWDGGGGGEEYVGDGCGEEGTVVNNNKNG